MTNAIRGGGDVERDLRMIPSPYTAADAVFDFDDATGAIILGKVGASLINLRKTATGQLEVRLDTTVVGLIDTDGSVLWGQTGGSQSNLFRTSTGALQMRDNITVVVQLSAGGTLTVGRVAAGHINIAKLTGGSVQFRLNATVLSTIQTTGVWDFGTTINLVTGGTLQTSNFVLGSVGAQIALNGNVQTADLNVLGALNHDGTTVGFYGVAPATRPAAITQTYSTAARTMNAYTADDESAAYSGIDNAQAGSVYAQLSDLNALRVAVENLRAAVENRSQVLNAVIDDLQANGLEQ
jgi:hypothetical protein